MESGPPGNGVRGPYFLIMSLFISPHPLIYERGELYHLNERKKLLHICQHVELVNYPFKQQQFFPDFQYSQMKHGYFYRTQNTAPHCFKYLSKLGTCL